jgi:hypothetical protein
MPIFETLPGESKSTSIISSITNLVCRQCGSMMEFQCNGRCRRSWFLEWEGVNFATAILAADGRTAKRHEELANWNTCARLLILILDKNI